MKRIFILLASSLLLISCTRTVTVRTPGGGTILIPNDTAKIGQEVSLATKTGTLYHILSHREPTGVKVIDSTELYIIQGKVIKVN